MMAVLRRDIRRNGVGTHRFFSLTSCFRTRSIDTAVRSQPPANL